MIGAVCQANTFQRDIGFLLIGHAVEVLCQHHVFQRREIGDEMELLKHESDLLGAEAR